MSLSFVGAIAVTSLFSSLVWSAPPANLSPAALECYRQALKSPTIFTMNKQYKNDLDIEKMVVSLCTYSDAGGALTCYKQAEEQSDVLPAKKQSLDVFRLEQHFGRLCSNSHQHLKNPKNGDLDAIDCFKTVIKDPQTLVAAKQYMGNNALEDLVTKMCISSNGKGATTCYKNALITDEILEANKEYSGPQAIDQIIVDLCKGSRLR